MKIISQPRRSGKTTAAIKLVAKHGAYIVVLDHRRAYLVAQQAEALGLHINFPLTLAELLNKSVHGFSRQKYIFDGADDMLQGLCGGQAIMATLTRDNSAKRRRKQ